MKRSASALLNLHFYAHAASGNVRLAVYDVTPAKNLLWQSASIPATAGWMSASIASGAPGYLALAAGTYWLACTTAISGTSTRVALIALFSDRATFTTWPLLLSVPNHAYPLPASTTELCRKTSPYFVSGESESLMPLGGGTAVPPCSIRLWQVDSNDNVPSYALGASGDGWYVEQTYGSFAASVGAPNSTDETWSTYIDYLPDDIFADGFGT